MIAVDSNAFIYYLNAKVPEHRTARSAMAKSKREGILVNSAVLMEVCHHLIKRMGAVDGKAAADRFLAGPFAIVQDLDLSLAERAVELLAKHTHTGIGGRDATILASMELHGVKRILTHDDAFSRIPGIDVVDPWRRPARAST